MSSSPFDLFRRNLKPLMVLLTGLAMFAFVVLPVLDTYMRRGATSGGDQVVAEFDGLELTQAKIDYFTRNHNATIRFLRELAEATIARGGSPRTAGFQYNTQARRIESLGINEAPSAEGTVRTIQFASQANEAGFALDDVAIQSWLQQFTDGMFSDGEINGMLMQSTRNQMGQYHLYEQLRSQLLADLYLRGAFATLIDGRMPMLTPAEQWDTFLKLNREATIDAYGVLANDFLSQTNANPGEPEIVAVYDQGKDRDPNDQSPEPAFHRRYSAKFEYLVGDYKTMLDEEIAKLSEAQLREEYDKRLKGGDFQLPENAAADLLDSMPKDEPAADPADPGGDADASPAAPPADAKADRAEVDEPTAPGEVAPADAAEADATPAKQGDARADDSQPAAKTSDPSTDAENADEAKSKPVDEETSKSADEETSKAADEETSKAADEETSKAADESDQSRLALGSAAVQLVAYQQDDPPSEPAKSDEPPAADEPTATTPGGEEAGDTEPEATSVPAAGTQPDADGSTENASAKTESETASPDPSDGGEDASKAPDEAPKVESFDDVRDQIAEDLAGPEARRRLDAAVQELTNKMRRYFSERAIYESNLSIGQEVDPPKKLDLKQLGAELGFQHEVIGPYDEVSIRVEPIAQSREVGSESMSRGPGFTMMMYGFDGGMGPIAPQPLYAPLRTADDQAGKRYVSWKIAETEARTPPLTEVRDDVVMYIRMREASKLALANAKEIAAQAASSDKPLAELVPEDRKDNLQQGLGPFSWLDQLGFQGATIGNVPELDSVGPEFMKAVFNTKLDDFGVAMNQPKRVAYVVKPTEFQPSIDELRRRFKEPTGRMMATFIGGSENNSVIQGFYKAIDDKSGYVNRMNP